MFPVLHDGPLVRLLVSVAMEDRLTFATAWLIAVLAAVLLTLVTVLWMVWPNGIPLPRRRRGRRRSTYVPRSVSL